MAKKKSKPAVKTARPRKANPTPLEKAAQVVGSVPTNISMHADMFNVIHTRVKLSDGVTQIIDPSEVRERLYEIIGNYGWEVTMGLLASCARLFAEVPTPLEPFSPVIKEALHGLAVDLDARRQTLRAVDRASIQAKRVQPKEGS